MHSDPNCIFCKITQHQIPANVVFENENLIAFHDIHPKAKVHILLLPKTHIPRLSDVTVEHSSLLSEMMLKLPQLAKQLALTNGFRTIINTGPGGGQEIDHLHLHLLGGGSLPKF